MAIWQYNFIVIPKTIFDGKSGLETYIDKEGFLDDDVCWLKEPINIDFFNQIEQFLPRNKSWSNDIVLFGDQDSNRFEVYKNKDDIVISVSFRIDYTSEYEDILRSVINFIEMNNLAILDEKLNLLSNNYLTIKSQIENSDQQTIYRKLSDKKD